MLRNKIKISFQKRRFHCTPVISSKTSKRRKDIKMQRSPNLQNVKHEKETPMDSAQKFFDSHYGKIYGDSWPSMRLALLSKPKFAALVNNFSTKEETIDYFKSLGCLSVKELYYEELSRLGIDLTQDNHQSISLPDYDESTRPSLSKKAEEEEETLSKEVEHLSMSKEEGKARIIDPENIIIGGKTSASMYEFMPSQETAGMEGFIENEDYFAKYGNIKSASNPFDLVPQGAYEFPEKLEAFVYPYGVFDHFKGPSRPAGGPFNYFCLDAASLLPVLMLDLQKGDELLDLCSGPGGKAIAAMQTMKPKRIVCNDIDQSRLGKVKNAMKSYLLDKFNESLGREVIEFSRKNGLICPDYYPLDFDKVLCDVPCFTDRHALLTEDFNIFHSTRVKERLRLPELQANLLMAAIKCLKPGGSVVYSTCTLSPMQNDGVIAMVIRRIWEESSIDIAILDLSETIQPFKTFLSFSEDTKVTRFGQQIVPNLGQNFGPMYFAKIKRLT